MKEDLRVIKTRENIENQLIECLKKYSFEEITVKMLVERSRINRSTFYRNYIDKYDLLDIMITQYLDALRENIDVRFIILLHKNAREYHPHLKPLLHFFRDNADKTITLWNAVLPVNFYAGMVSLFSDKLLEAMKKHYKIPLANLPFAQLYAELFASHTLTTIKWWLVNMPSLSEDEILDILTKNTEKGLFLAMEKMFNQ